MVYFPCTNSVQGEWGAPFLPGLGQCGKHALPGMCAPKSKGGSFEYPYRRPHGRRWHATPGTGHVHMPSISAWYQRWGCLKPQVPALGAHIPGREYFFPWPRLGRKGHLTHVVCWIIYSLLHRSQCRYDKTKSVQAGQTPVNLTAHMCFSSERESDLVISVYFATYKFGNFPLLEQRKISKL